MTSNEELLSIVIDNYNYGQYMAQAIESALAQDYEKLEVVVVDDGSNDSSREVIASYGERVVAVFKHNGGQASALNAGFAASRGDVLLFLDSDDYLAPQAGGSVMRRFRERPELSKVHFRLTVVDESARPTGGVLPARHMRMPGGDIRNVLATSRTYPHPPMSGNAYRRSAIARQMPIPEQIYRKGADGWLVCTAPVFGPVEAIDEELGCYRVHSANVTGKNELADGKRFAAHVDEDECARRKQVELFRDVLDTRISAVAERDLPHIRQLLILRKIYPERYRYPWTSVTLLLRGLRAAILTEEVRPIDRAIWLLWFVTIAILPRRVAYPIVLATFDAGRRPSMLRALLGRRGRR